MKRIMVQLTEEQMKALKEPSMDEKHRQALEALNTIEREGYRDIEGKTDLSINHDKYFAEGIQ